ncbi:MAG: helix-turn-helix transcriptional regulator [Parasphingorhabdus sp.]|uniref:helix-turn-helix domain-containing protein n=1 Tax=Parasphingorhabdus sp. TaxID=2709688 RepID=UPI0030034EE2
MDIRIILGANTRRFRRERQLSQEALAEKIGADRAYVSAIERGLQNMTIVRVSELAIALDVAFVELFGAPKSDD